MQSHMHNMMIFILVSSDVEGEKTKKKGFKLLFTCNCPGHILSPTQYYYLMAIRPIRSAHKSLSLLLSESDHAVIVKSYTNTILISCENPRCKDCALFLSHGTISSYRKLLLCKNHTLFFCCTVTVLVSP